MTERVKKSLLDIYENIEQIESFLGEKRDFLEYQQNKMKKMAVERAIEIIGEAMNRALKEDKI